MRRSSSPLARRRPRPGLLITLAIVPLLAAVAGCGSSSGPASASSSTGAPSTPGTSAASDGASSVPSAGPVTYPATIKADNGEVALPARPKAIVSLAPSLTEMLYAIGAGGQVKAVDELSNYPAAAPRTRLSGFQPNAEAIAGYSPDLVVLSNDSGGLVAALTRLKLPVLLLNAPTTLEASYSQELTLGRATGHVAEAQQVIDTTKSRIAAAVAAVPGSATSPSAKPLKVYHELDATYYSVTSSTFIGDLYKRFGLVNIADSAPKVAGGYPKLSGEFVVSSAPDLIVLADGKCCQQSATTVAKRPAFAAVPAVVRGRVVVVDDDIASRWGPRVADFAGQIARALGAAA